MSTYFAILTEVGEAKLANAIALGQTLKLKNLAVGDGNGNLPMPVRTQKALVREVRRAGLNQLSIDPANASQIIVEQVLPEDVGGWWIREIGIYDEAGDLCAVANCPPSYKPQMAEGSGRTQVVRIVLIVASTAAIELKIDPSVILATRKYVDEQAGSVLVHADRQLAAHLAAADPHPLLAKRSYVDEQAGSVLVHGEKQLAGHLAAADPHPQLAQRSYVDEQAGSVLVHAGKQLAAHLAAADPHPQLAQRSYVDEQAGSVLVHGEKQLAAHLGAADPHPQLAHRSYVDEQAGSVLAHSEQQLAAHLGAADPHPQLAHRAYVDEQAGSVLVYGEKQLTAHQAAADPHPQYSMKEVATLPKFNTSKKLVNAEFVQQEQGNLAGLKGIAVSRPLVAGDIGHALYFVNDDITVTLPRPDSIANGNIVGRRLTFFGYATVSGTISPGDGAFLGYDVGSVASLLVKPGQSLSVVATNGSTWQVIDSTAEMGRNADFASRLLKDGYQPLPGGLIMQWQTISVPAATTGISTKDFSFPIAFKEAAFGCTASISGIGASPDSNAFVSAMANSINGGVAQSNYIHSNVSIFIISIGK
ncbi:hypothetical protein VM94_00895 [Janthinobacterium sp. KBS0711]|uniref:phage tail protein n=1 Tax=Janthinobacterium sp. KBS0711 TaxID=1649647 RepID=UPI00063931BD|nr:phage tail protein [Janthinobacterium sp. KBS0711]KKO65360.1 hypothetical protein VM94_00895 [Janthinobacterium sp. KBS0711]TSD71196.1 phage tail protein [Janthinobacterium sp. KBS0711]